MRKLTLVFLVACHAPVEQPKSEEKPGTAAAEAPPAYVLTGDLKDMQDKKTIRFLVTGSDDYMPRDGDPAASERALAEAFAKKLGLAPVFVHAERGQLIDDLNAGHGDVIAASLAVTSDRSDKITFS